MKYNTILRFRFSDEIASILKRFKNVSTFVREAVREKLEREGYLEYKNPF